jgi:hypothetical protein
VAADRDSSGTDTVKISETSTAATADADDIDPDAANYAAGNDPDTAYRNQGRADSPNGWGSQTEADGYPENNEHDPGDYADGADEHDQPHEDRYDNDKPDLWGDTDPDAAIYAELDSHAAGNPDGRQDSDREDKPAQENASLKQSLADANQEIADLKAELKAAKNKQADLIEQPPAGVDKYQDKETGTPDHGADEPDGLRKQDALLDERITIGQRADTKREEQTRWRRVASAENVGAAGTLLGAADLAMHGVPGLAVALGATAIGVASWGQAKIEKRRKGMQ